MATSSSTDYNRTATQIVNRAMRHMGVLAQEETPGAAELEDGLEALNVMVKMWQADGINLWKQEDLIVWLVKGTTKYTLSSSGDHAATSWVRTTLSAAAAASAATITVASISGISASDNLGIVLDDGTLQWTTVSGAPAGSTITPAAVVTSAAASGNQVWAYTTKAPRPLRVDIPRLRDSSVQDTPIFSISREEYFNTPNKTSQSRPVSVYYDPQLSQGELHVWPAPETVDDTILLSAKMPIEDFDALTNNPDLPQEWLNALAWGLAEEMALEYEVPPDRHQRIAAKAGQLRAMLAGWDNEAVSILMQPDFGP